MKPTLLKAANNGERFELTSPTAMPNACGFLWNKKMMIQINCRGYAIAQFMQPEPAKYTHAPNLEAKTFMQPEQPYYAHHPGRFFYIKDEDTGEIFSAPFAPTKVVPEQYTFSAGKYDVQWEVKHLGIQVNLTLTLPTEDIVEQWECHVKNIGTSTRNLSIYPYFPFGYMSWMNQSGEYRKDLGGIVANCITPYQKYKDYFKNINFKDKTYFLHEQTPTSYDVNQSVFEGETGLQNPQGIQQTQLSNSDAIYETPAAVLQYRTNLEPQQQKSYRFLLGPAKTEEEITHIRSKYFGEGFDAAKAVYKKYVDAGKGVIQVNTPDEHFNNHTNHWLARQVYYHGDVNRLTTDPQTRNYLQDNMGMSYIAPQTTRAAFLHALSQQEASGAMPDGIILVEGTELKYINQIPHTDHCVWLPVCLQAYLDETNDYALLDEAVTDEAGVTLSVFERISRAMDWLIKSTDERGLSYIAQGDWCDPMNMVGYKGKGVSGWLSVATAYALKLWARVCHQSNQPELAAHFSKAQEAINHSVNTHLWDEQWYARGITDDNVTFGIKADTEGRIFLNPQSWAILADTCTPEKTACMLKAIEEQLETPYGPMMFAPAYTSMREDVGRVTQKFPGSAENGSVYNHASVFYIYSLYTIGEGEKAYDLLRKMLTGPSEQDYLTRGQMPIYIPNYYRGAYYQHPRTAGRSSQLFNTGTVAWVYRCLIEGLFGLKGSPEGLNIQPQLPKAWHTASATRAFRGATFDVTYKRANTNTTQVLIDGTPLTRTYENTPCITQIVKGQHYKVEVLLPEAGNE